MDNQTQINWPPSFTIKKHARAKHVKLKASRQHGLEIVVPLRFNSKYLPSILEENRTWIEKQLKKILEQPSIEKIKEAKPSEIILLGIDQIWKVEYVPVKQKLRLMTRPYLNEVVLLGNIENELGCKELLIAWLKQHAHIHLTKQLNQLSSETQLPFHHLTIRDQSSRWGSCSSKKVINLNYKLLFLPSELMKHILIHELCHTKQMNHSEKFWRLVEEFDPDWATHKKKLRQANQYIPTWLT